MPQFANCQIGIKIGDNLLEEYGTQIVESAVTTWIASESGRVCSTFFISNKKMDVDKYEYPCCTNVMAVQEFEIVFQAENHPCSLQLVIFVDGVELVNRGYEHRKMGKDIICSGLSINAETVQPFVFSDIVFPGA
jgi:hypothetical protein